MQRSCQPVAVLMLAAVSVARAASEAAAGLGALSGRDAQPLAGHPVLSFLAHVIFLTVILGMGAAAVAVLFKPPFET